MPIGAQGNNNPYLNFNSHDFGIENSKKEFTCVSQKYVCIAKNMCIFRNITSASLDPVKKIKRVLVWQPQRYWRVGPLRYCWDTMLVAMDADFWDSMLPEFSRFQFAQIM